VKIKRNEWIYIYKYMKKGHHINAYRRKQRGGERMIKKT